jgi:cyclopropane fatty-acyl-phospholipid synthase-like methyltransferase
MSTPGWFPDELAHAGPEHLDPACVPGYDPKANTDPAEDIGLLRTLGLSERHTVVDMGAGTGTFALAAAAHCARVIAVDVSSPMLARLEAKAAALGIANVRCVQAGFLSYEHEGDPVDIVYSRNALHHLPDFWKAIALQRIAAMLKPGGIFRLHDIVYSFDPDDAGCVLEAWFASAAADPADGWTRAELETHVRDEHSTFSWLLEPMIERAGFTIQDAAHRPVGTYAAYTCVKTG